MTYLWIKAWHVIAVIAWMSGLFYLPRLFVYHSQCNDTSGHERFCVMERRLYYGIIWPAGVVATVLGGWMLVRGWPWFRSDASMHVKLAMVGSLWVYHGLCGYYRTCFLNGCNRHSHVFYRWFNEYPTLVLVVSVVMVVVKPLGVWS